MQIVFLTARSSRLSEASVVLCAASGPFSPRVLTDPHSARRVFRVSAWTSSRVTRTWGQRDKTMPAIMPEDLERRPPVHALGCREGVQGRRVCSSEKAGQAVVWGHSCCGWRIHGIGVYEDQVQYERTIHILRSYTMNITTCTRIISLEILGGTKGLRDLYVAWRLNNDTWWGARY